MLCAAKGDEDNAMVPVLVLDYSLVTAPARAIPSRMLVWMKSKVSIAKELQRNPSHTSRDGIAAHCPTSSSSASSHLRNPVSGMHSTVSRFFHSCGRLYV